MTTLDFESSIKLAKRAKDLRDKAKIIEEKAVESFQRKRATYIKELQQEKAELEAEIKTLETEYFELALVFCRQKGSHSYGNTITVKRIPYVSSEFSFCSGGIRYNKINYRTCSICGNSNNPKNFYQDGCQTAIQEAAEQIENLELKETAKRILKIQEQLEKLTGNLNVTQSILMEICSIFGHDAEEKSNDDYKCRCCGREIGYDTYVGTYRNAKYKGGIIPNYYDSSTIL